MIEVGVPVTPNPSTPEEGSHNIFKKYDQRAVPRVPPYTEGEDFLKSD